MSLYKTMKNIGMAALLIGSMATTAAIGYATGSVKGNRAGYLRGHMDGKLEGRTEIVETIEKYAPGTIDEVVSEMEDEIQRAEFEQTLQEWIEPSEYDTPGIEPDFEKWLQEGADEAKPEHQNIEPPKPRIPGNRNSTYVWPV